MSDPIIKGVKRPASRPNTRSASPASSAKSRKLSAKSARPKPLAKRPTGKKAPVRKAAKGGATATKATRSAPSKPAAKPKRAPVTKKASAPVRKAAKSSSKPSSKTSARAAAKPQPKRAATPSSKHAAKHAAKPTTKKAPTPTRPTLIPRQPTADETAALRDFERAHKEFARGRFAEARMLFRKLIEQHAGAAEVTARARTYLAIAEARLRSESALPRNAEELYDRGVIELNRGEYVAAQEMFERALRREPEAAHIHYGLAATRARLGSVDLALQSLERALQLQPSLRLRAQHDLDLMMLRNDPDYERIVFASRQ
jgi:tetratricopeptide (TPR) repeat protein